MMFDQYPGCCGAYVVTELPCNLGDSDHVEDREYFFAEVSDYSKYPSKRLFTILDVRFQRGTMKLLLANGWEKVGKSWRNPDTKNWLQQLTYYKPIRRRKSRA